MKLSHLGKGSHNIESLKRRLKGLCECIESSMHAHADSHRFSKLRIPRWLQALTKCFIQHIEHILAHRIVPIAHAPPASEPVIMS